MSNPQNSQTIESTIATLINCQDKEMRDHLEQQIVDFMKNRSLAFQQLFQTTTNPNIQEGIKQYATTLLKKMAHDMDNATEAEAIQLANSLLSLIFSQEFPFHKKKQFSEILKLALNPAVFNQETSPANIIMKATMEVVMKIDFKVGDDEPGFSNLLGALLCLRAVFKSRPNASGVNHLFNQYFTFIMSLFDLMIEKRIDRLRSSEFNKKKMENIEVRERCNRCLILLSQYIKLVKIIFKSLRSLRPEKLKVWATNVNLLKKFNAFVFIEVGNLTINKSNVLFNSCALEDYNTTLHKIKTKAVHIFQILFENYIEKREEENMELEIYYKSLAKTSIEGLHTFYKSTQLSYDNIEDDQKLSKFIRRVCKFLLKSIEFPDHLELYIKTRQIFIKDIILINLVAGARERENSLDNPDEFVNSQKDFLLYRRSKTIKILMSKILDQMCLHIDGALTYVTLILLDLMKFLCQGNNGGDLSNHPYASQFADSRFFKEVDSIGQLESSLLTITLLVRNMRGRDDLVKSCIDFITEFSSILANSNDIVKVRFVSFLISFLSKLTSKDEHTGNRSQTATELFSWLLQQVQGSEVMSRITISNIEIILKKKNRTQDMFYVDLPDEFLDALMVQLSRENPKGPLKLIIMFLKNASGILETNSEKLQQLFILIKSVIANNYQDDTPEGFEIVTLAWNCLKSICETRTLTLLNYEFLLKNVSDFFAFIFEGKKINWDEDIIDCVFSMMKIKKELPINADVVFNSFELLQKQYEGRVSVFLTMITYMITNFPEFFDQTRTEKLLHIANIALSEKEYSESSAYYLADGFLFLSIIIQHLGDKFSDQQIAFCVELYKQKSKDILSVKELNDEKALLIDKNESVLLSLLLKIPQKTVALIGNEIPLYVQTIKNSSVYFETAYECKLLILGLMNLLKILVQANVPQFENATLSLFNFLTAYMAFIANQEFIKLYDKLAQRRNLTKQERKYYEIKEELVGYLPFDQAVYDLWFDADDYEYDRYYDDYIDADEIFNKSNYNREKENMARSIYSVVTEVDEFESFNNLLKFFQSTCLEVFNDIVSRGDDVPLKYLLSVARNMRYISLEGGKTKKLRKIVKIRRNGVN